MTPKEKADELYSIFKNTLNIGAEMRQWANPFVKECCLSLCDEMILQLDQTIDPELVHYWHGEKAYLNAIELHDFWNNVKTEIKNL